MLNRTVPIAQSFATGAVVAGKYRIEAELGAGGMGRVLAAMHLQLGQRVAIKILSPQILASEEGRARFAREAQVSARIRSEHVARTMDVGTLANGAPYIVMEYLDGEDLTTRLRRGGPLSIDQSMEFILQACEAVADAHALGIVHRDLKPSNLFIIRRSDGSEAVKVLDFGVSKVVGGADAEGDVSMTKTSALMGSPVYMSPEQMTSARNVDSRTDIWALGATLYEMLAGGPPFMAGSLPELCSQVLTFPTPSLRARRPDVPPGIEKIVYRCLQKNPAERYETIAGFAAALSRYAPERAKPTAERIARIIFTAGLTESVVGPPSSTGAGLPPDGSVQHPSALGTVPGASVQYPSALGTVPGASVQYPSALGTAPGASVRYPSVLGTAPDASNLYPANSGTEASWGRTAHPWSDWHRTLVVGTAVVICMAAGAVWGSWAWLKASSPTAASASPTSSLAAPAPSAMAPDSVPSEPLAAHPSAVASAEPAPSAAPAEAKPDVPPARPATKVGSAPRPAAESPARAKDLPADRVGGDTTRPAPSRNDRLMLDRL